MKLFKQSILAVLAVTVLVSCQKEEHNVLTKQEKADGWELLFDGKTLDGWRDYNGDSLTVPWFVEDGMILAKGTGADEHGYIVTDSLYDNFELVWDWKIAVGGNSGVLYHVVESPDYAVPYVTGPEYQMLDTTGYEGLEDWQITGADYAMYVTDPEKTIVKPAGEWNSSKIIFDNGHVEHWLNGEKVVDFEAWSDDWNERKSIGKWKDTPQYGMARTGAICLQDHGSAAWFRNMKIKRLPTKEN